MRILVSTVVQDRLKCMVSGLRIPDFRAQGFMEFSGAVQRGAPPRLGIHKLRGVRVRVSESEGTSNQTLRGQSAQ